MKHVKPDRCGYKGYKCKGIYTLVIPLNTCDLTVYTTSSPTRSNDQNYWNLPATFLGLIHSTDFYNIKVKPDTTCFTSYDPFSSDSGLRDLVKTLLNNETPVGLILLCKTKLKCYALIKETTTSNTLVLKPGILMPKASLLAFDTPHAITVPLIVNATASGVQALNSIQAQVYSQVAQVQGVQASVNALQSQVAQVQGVQASVNALQSQVAQVQAVATIAQQTATKAGTTQARVSGCGGFRITLVNSSTTRKKAVSIAAGQVAVTDTVYMSIPAYTTPVFEFSKNGINRANIFLSALYIPESLDLLALSIVGLLVWLYSENSSTPTKYAWLYSSIGGSWIVSTGLMLVVGSRFTTLGTIQYKLMLFSVYQGTCSPVDLKSDDLLDSDSSTYNPKCAGLLIGTQLNTLLPRTFYVTISAGEVRAYGKTTTFPSFIQLSSAIPYALELLISVIIYAQLNVVSKAITLYIDLVSTNFITQTYSCTGGSWSLASLSKLNNHFVKYVTLGTIYCINDGYQITQVVCSPVDLLDWASLLTLPSATLGISVFIYDHLSGLKLWVPVKDC